MKRRYPLEAVRDLRRKKVEDDARELAARTRAVKRAEAGHARARAERVQVEAQVDRCRKVELDELEAGRLKAADLERGAAWDAAARARIAELRDREQASDAALKASLGEEARAKKTLEQHHGESDVLERHRRAFLDEQARTLERVAEEAAADAFAARRGRS